MTSTAGLVARNAASRAGAEALGKVASLALMAVLARAEGPRGIGILFLALAWAELGVTAIDLGFDRYLMRRIARDRAALHELFFNVLALKAARAVPVLAVVAGVSFAVYDATTRWTVLALSAAFLLDSVGYTLASVFTALERSGPVALSLVAQRLISAGAGSAALVAGLGVVGVACAYVIASTVAVGLGAALLRRHAGMPRLELSAAARAQLRRDSLPFAAQEVLAVGITRADALLLSALATPAAIGFYAAAYRLFEATLLVSNALVGAFAAMFTYLGDVDARAAFERALKVTLALLAPCAIAMAMLAETLLSVAFGPGFAAAAGPLRILAPTALVLGVALITLALVASRTDPRASVRAFALALLVNVALNVALVGSLGATGAALAMLGTELVLAAALMRRALRAVGPLALTRLGAGPLTGALAMTVTVWALGEWPAAALAGGLLAYGAGLLSVELRMWPDDARVVRTLVRRPVRVR